MAQGPNEARFRTSLTGASAESVDAGADEWERCATLLDTVSRSLETAAGKDEQIGGQTGPAMGAAFRRTSKSVAERAELLREGRTALRSAARAISDAGDAREAMDKAHPAVDNPGTWTRPVGPLTEEDLDDQAKHQKKVQDYQETYAARERISQRWADHIDTVFADSTETMKKIHGEPDPEKPGGDDGGGPGRIPTTRGIPQGPGDDSGDDGDPRDGDPRDDPRDDDPRDDDPRDDEPRDDDSGDDNGDDPGDTPPIYTDHGTDGGGLSTGTLGGLAAGGTAGALGLSRLRGGLALPSALSSTGVRPIGSTGRVGASGALGRGGALAPGSPVTRGGGAGRGVGAGGIGTRGNGKQGGGRGTGRGGRAGAGGIGTGRGAGKKDEEKKQAPHDLFDDGEDWIDDEGAAPDVLN